MLLYSENRVILASTVWPKHAQRSSELTFKAIQGHQLLWQSKAHIWCLLVINCHLSRICATTWSVSQKWISAGCVLQRLTPLSFQQPDSLLLVIVPSRSPAIAYVHYSLLTDVTSATTLPVFLFSFKIILIFCSFSCMTCIRLTLTLFRAIAVCF